MLATFRDRSYNRRRTGARRRSNAVSRFPAPRRPPAVARAEAARASLRGAPVAWRARPLSGRAGARARPGTPLCGIRGDRSAPAPLSLLPNHRPPIPVYRASPLTARIPWTPWPNRPLTRSMPWRAAIRAREAAHARGTVLSEPSRRRGADSRTHMQDEPVRVTARFSNGSGDPGTPDYAREGRGLAVKFYLADGSRTDVVALDCPSIVRTPEDFVEFTRARELDPETGQPDWGRWAPFSASIPRRCRPSRPPSAPTRPRARDGRLQLDPRLSLDRRGRRALGALPLRARGGRATLGEEEAQARGADYLQEEIASRESAAFPVLVVIARPRIPSTIPTPGLAAGA